MKIGIITIEDMENYGNRLQNYAVQQILKSLGCESETLRRSSNSKKNIIKKKVKNLCATIYSKNIKTNNKKLNLFLRIMKFQNFTLKFICQSKYEILKNNVPLNILQEYDYFISGSDQVWNPTFEFNSEIEFLTFAKPGQRIALSPSFGVSELPSYCIDSYKQWINGIDYLSVRENAGANIIKNLIGKNAIVLLDPTFMLSKIEWLDIATKPKWINHNKKFILSYFLGAKSKETETWINNVAISKDLEIINLLDINNKDVYSIDPSEFIWCTNNCELMCTDSFHGVVFSLVMKKPFIVFERRDDLVSMNSRLDTLLNKFHMGTRKKDQIIYENDIFNVDYSNVDNIINNEKSKTLDYLKNALGLDL